MRHSLMALLVLVVITTTAASRAQDDLPVARAMIAEGEVTAIAATGERRFLTRRDALYSGDTLQTATDAVLQLRFIDGGLLFLRPDSTLVISEYSYDGGAAGSVTLNLVSGVLRTITGDIDATNYSLTFPTGTVRLTTPGSSDILVSSYTQEPAYFAVYHGGAEIITGTGSLSLGVGADFDFGSLRPGAPPQGQREPGADPDTNAVTILRLP